MKKCSVVFWRILFGITRIPLCFQIFVTDRYYKVILDIHPTASVGSCYIDNKNVSIGEETYIKSGEIFAGESCVTIGKYCVIGKNVSIKGRTHDLKRPTGGPKYSSNLQKYADITIGNYVWLGDNVFIREGVTVGDHAVVAANSVVVKDVPCRAIVGGVPASFIRYNDRLAPENF